MKNILAKTLIGVAFFAFTFSARAEEPTPVRKIDCQVTDLMWTRPCEEYVRIALRYFNEAEESGGISRATDAAFGHFALDMYHECRRRSGVTTYSFPSE